MLSYVLLESPDAGGAETLSAIFNTELDPLVLPQRGKPTALDVRVMHKYVLSSLTRDEAVPFAVVEPLDGSLLSFSHFPNLYSLLMLTLE